jgi:hypothetical protein
VVAALLEEGEHGYLAARVASQVIKAYVDKQKRQPTKVAQGNGKVEIGAVWSEADPNEGGNSALRGGHYLLDVSETRAPLAAAAPGVN